MDLSLFVDEHVATKRNGLALFDTVDRIILVAIVIEIAFEDQWHIFLVSLHHQFMDFQSDRSFLSWHLHLLSAISHLLYTSFELTIGEGIFVHEIVNSVCIGMIGSSIWINGLCFDRWQSVPSADGFSWWRIFGRYRLLIVGLGLREER